MSELPAVANPTSVATYYTISTDRGAMIGHASREIALRDNGREIIDSQDIVVGDQGSPSLLTPWSIVAKSSDITQQTSRVEDKTGQVVSLSSYSKSGADWSRVEVRVIENTATITRQTPVESRTIIVPLPSAVRFDNGDGLLGDFNNTAETRVEFDNFNIDAMAVEHVIIDRVPIAPPKPQIGVLLLRKCYQGSQLMAVTRLHLDTVGGIVESDQPIYGANIVIKLADREIALAAPSTYHVLNAVMMKSPFLISGEALKGRIRYRFAFRDGIAFNIPQTGEQHVRTEPGVVTVDICPDCGPGLLADSASLADALKPTAWLQSDSAGIKSIADPVASMPVSDEKKMELLLEKARPYLGTVDFNGHYSALETLSRRKGDCTEASVLLAALGRAAGIPTLVANGLVYSRASYHGVSNVFMPHSWTLAYVDGQWRSFDLALGKFDSTHIALAVGNGDERSLFAASQLAGLLDWQDMAEVRTAQEN